MNAEDQWNLWQDVADKLCDGDGESLDDLLGITEFNGYCNRPATEDYPMSSELRSLLLGLLGPYSETILKAYRIKKGLEP